jgi:hypothetical protein
MNMKGRRVMEKNDHATQRNVIQEKDLQKIIELLETIQYGSVTVIVQDGKILQIEKNEKIRLK